jgi:hypothetical protein
MGIHGHYMGSFTFLPYKYDFRNSIAPSLYFILLLSNITGLKLISKYISGEYI